VELGDDERKTAFLSGTRDNERKTSFLSGARG